MTRSIGSKAIAIRIKKRSMKPIFNKIPIFRIKYSCYKSIFIFKKFPETLNLIFISIHNLNAHQSKRYDFPEKKKVAMNLRDNPLFDSTNSDKNISFFKNQFKNQMVIMLESNYNCSSSKIYAFIRNNGIGIRS